MSKQKIIVVYKKSTFQMYEDKLDKINLKKKNKELYNGIILAHKEHHDSLNIMKKKLGSLSIPVIFHMRGEKKMPAIKDNDIVIALGGDGTFIFASHFVSKALMVGVNSAPDFSIGHFCRYNLFDSSIDLRDQMEKIILGKIQPTELHRLKISINGIPVHIPVINDFLIVDKNPATTSRYIINYNGKHYYQKSSGIWLSTAMGSSAAFSSSGGLAFPQFSHSNKRQFGLMIREPYRPDAGTLLEAIISEDDMFEIIISMIDGYVFFDGGQKKINIQIGDVITIAFQKEPLRAILK
jgi:NAD+ kinase